MLSLEQIIKSIFAHDQADRDRDAQSQYFSAVDRNPGRAVHRHHVEAQAGGITRQSLNDAFRIINQRNYDWNAHHNVPMNFDREALDQMFAQYADTIVTPSPPEPEDSADEVNWIKEGF